MTTPAWIGTHRGSLLATATLALACLAAAPAQALQAPEPRSLPDHGPGSPLRQGNRIVAEVHFDRGALAARGDLRATGARILDASGRYQVVTVAAGPGEMKALRAVDGVESASPVLTPIGSATCGSVISEGDTQLAAAEARADFGVDGSGVGVGILSDSFNTDAGAASHTAQDIASGDLPGPGNPCGYTSPVSLLGPDLFSPVATDEGRGMAQIVHDLAPGAGISFATAFTGETSFAENIRALAGAGASVLVDDVGYPEEPVFQDGPIAVAIDEVVAKGGSYFSAAGNDNLIFEGKDFASWETPEFRDAAECPPQLLAATGYTHNCLDFDPGEESGEEDNTFGITVEEGATLLVDVQWAEPWEGVNADIDAYLLDETGTPLIDPDGIVGSTEDNPGVTQKPVEVVGWENPGPETEVQLAINRCFTTQEEAEKEETGCNPGADPSLMPRLKLILAQNGSGVKRTEYLESSGGDIVGPTIAGHPGVGAAVSVGAVRVGAGQAPEPYSSRGPVTHYYGPVTGTGPSAPSVESIAKPNVAATDCGRTTFFVPSNLKGIFRFCGTSAAAPHAAAVAALARQANPSLTPAEIRDGLAATARPVGPPFEPDAVGGGLVDAHRLLEEVALPPKISIDAPPRALSNNPSPQIGFRANRPVSFACSLDGSEPLPCTSPFTPDEPLNDGQHAFAVRGEDLAGKVGVSETVRFTVDTIAPRTRFRRHPRRTIRTHRRRAKAVFRIAASEPGARFVCRVDGGLLRFCSERFARRYGAGRHVMRAMAVDAAGNVDRTPAKFRFRVKRVGRHTAARRHSRRSPPLPPKYQVPRQ